MIVKELPVIALTEEITKATWFYVMEKASEKVYSEIGEWLMSTIGEIGEVWQATNHAGNPDIKFRCVLMDCKEIDKMEVERFLGQLNL